MDHTPGDSAVSGAAPGGDNAVEASFDDIEQARRAVRGLLEKSIPANSIGVLLLSRDGTILRRVPVEDEAGALRGALIGGVVGAGIGVLVITVAGILAIRGGTPSGLFSFGGAFAAIAGTAGGCVPLGALWGMGSWRGPPELRNMGDTTNRVVVRVESAGLAGLARQVLEDRRSP